MDFAGLPLHPLVVHAAVVLVPLSVLSAWALALLPGWRWLTRWAALVVTAGALGAVVLARASGKALLEDLPFLSAPDSPVRDLMETHQARAGVLLVVMVAFAALVALAFWLLPAPTGLASGRLNHPGRPERWVGQIVPAALLALGAVALVWVALTGDAGSRAVWGQ